MQRSVLIIDDEIDQCLLISAYLRKKDFRVDCAHTLKAGIEKLRLNPPDSLLLDNNLPDGLGWKHATLIHGLFPGVHIMLITAGDIRDHVPVGAYFKMITKPMHLAELEAYVNAA